MFAAVTAEKTTRSHYAVKPSASGLGWALASAEILPNAAEFRKNSKAIWSILLKEKNKFLPECRRAPTGTNVSLKRGDTSIDLGCKLSIPLGDARRYTLPLHVISITHHGSYKTSRRFPVALLLRFVSPTAWPRVSLHGFSLGAPRMQKWNNCICIQIQCRKKRDFFLSRFSKFRKYLHKIQSRSMYQLSSGFIIDNANVH